MRNRIKVAVTLQAALLLAASLPALSQTTNTNHGTPFTAPISAGDDAETQDQMIRLLRQSPKLTTVIVRDPSLLADQDYVSRNNPQLAQFLQAHPEVVRNPDFYLFAKQDNSRHPDDVLERKIWPDLVPAPDPNSETRRMVDDLFTTAAFVCFLATLIWLIRILMENRRWTRIFKLQTEVHTRLIERFGSNQELLTYMETEAGKRFLEAAPIPVDLHHGQQLVPGPVARVLLPLQLGVVLTLLGIGLLMLRHSLPDLSTPLLISAIVALMPGLGFILSAGITWALAARLGLLPSRTDAPQAEALHVERNR